MKNNLIMKKLQNDYNMLIGKGYEVLGIFLQGSQNYGLDYEGSDIDSKAILLPSFEDFVKQNKPISTTMILESEEHIDLKDIRLMFECFKKQNINFVEILFTEYKIINPKYERLLAPMLENNEKIARYNKYASLNCMSGMCMEKLKALKHPYPTILAKIEKFGYDPKQLHHIVRLYNFVLSYTSGVPYSECLRTRKENREYMINVKKGLTHTLKQAEEDAKSLSESVYKITKEYMSNNPLVIDKEVEDIMEKVLIDILKLRFKEELI